MLTQRNFFIFSVLILTFLLNFSYENESENFLSEKNRVKNTNKNKFCINLYPKYIRGIVLENNTNEDIKVEIKFDSDNEINYYITKGKKMKIERGIKVENASWEKCDPIKNLVVLCKEKRTIIELIPEKVEIRKIVINEEFCEK